AYPTVKPYQGALTGSANAFVARIDPGGSTGTCGTGQFFAEYFSNITLTPPAARTQCEGSINYDWGIGGPAGVPPDHFSARWTGLFFADYFSNTTLAPPAARTACEGAPNYPWGAGGPAGLPVDNFSARWTGSPTFNAGSYTFTVRADDGVRLFLDGTLIIDGWKDQPATTYTATRTLTAGAHEVKIEHYERGGDAMIQASWTQSGGGPPPAGTLATPQTAAPGRAGL